MRKEGIIRRYWNFMPAEIQWISKDEIVTLGEGETRLWRARNFENYLDETYKNFKARVYFKIEGDNCGSWSFKDRGMTVAVTKAKNDGKKIAICASTGNTAASAAAYCKAAGMRCFVLLPAGNVAPGKMVQVDWHGAVALQIGGNFDTAMEIVKKIVVLNQDVELLNSLNPYRMEGQKTAAFEIIDELGNAPHYHFIPVGNGGNITAYWQGYREYYYARPRRSSRFPKMMGYQAIGSAPIALGRIVESPQTIASAIRIGNPVKWREAELAVKESYGKIGMVSDNEILTAYDFIHKFEPVSCEPSSAVSVAGLISEVALRPREIFSWYGCEIVCTLTGAGSKDFDTAKKVFSKEPKIIDALYETVTDIIMSK